MYAEDASICCGFSNYQLLSGYASLSVFPQFVIDIIGVVTVARADLLPQAVS